ncbi:hypothetical protein AWN73_07025 [Clostridium butyricum]|uniref:DUF1566 domain-containing protein n=1 Tax=Clostridium butyricum TaxID=1492 RepID=A0A2S7FF82_CLOBU|nr:hypothetical protein [Clostridium butyricum]PPV17749.1 hypothetical protein AWN73_07025 [Clostridium butyricum]
MENINVLIEQRDEILSKIKNIEESCEGIDNENNAKKITALNMNKSNLIAQKTNITAELQKIEQQLSSINVEINNLSGKGIDRILDAIKEQRWYFFKNKPKVLMDRETGLLWANLDYYNSGINENGDDHNYNEKYSSIFELNLDGYLGWKLPNKEQFIKMIEDKTFPFQKGEYHAIKEKITWRIENGSNAKSISLSSNFKSIDSWSSQWLPCNQSLMQADYANNVCEDNKIYAEKERLQFTLDLFTNNNLEPIFNDEEITALYRKIFIEKPVLIDKLNELQLQINDMQKEVLLSSTFDYNTLLIKYDLKNIDKSVIKYYEAVKKWIDNLMDKMKYYEEVKSDIIRDCNVIGLSLSKKYEDSPNLTDEENELLKSRQMFFKKHFELGMNNVNLRLLSIKKQAERIENRIEEINDGDNAIEELALLESENRASFSFIAENTSNIIKNALVKIEYFEKHKNFTGLAVKVWDEWTDDYKAFKTAKKEELKNLCEDDGIEQEIWECWFEDWNKNRLVVEKQLLPLIERGLKGDIITNEVQADSDVRSSNVIRKLLELLKTYKENIDDFYIEERKGIYQKFAFQSGGDLQEKFESESQLYKITSGFQEELQKIIFSLIRLKIRYSF